MAHVTSFRPKQVRLDALSAFDVESFKRFYEIYAAMFPLEDEREPPEEFFRIMGFNQDLAVQAAYGPYREVVAAVRLWDGGPIVGGHVFGVTTSPEHVAAGIPASVQIIYTFLHEAHRGVLPVPNFVNYAQDVAISTFGMHRSRDPLVVFEVNNPLRMSPQEIEADTQHSGLHPARRYMFWLRSGFRPLAIPYVQPRLRDDAEPVRYLDLFCGGGYDAVPAAVLRSHLRAFCSISVLKCREARDDPEFKAMEDWLAGRAVVPVLGRRSDEVQKIAALGLAQRRGLR